jgi:hypothetical protein
VSGLRVGEKILPRHQPPHARPARVTDLDNLVAENMLHGRGVNTVRGNNKIGLQDLAALGRNLSVLGVLARAYSLAFNSTRKARFITYIFNNL